MHCPNVIGSGFTNVIEPNQRLFNTNIFALISSPELMAADRVFDNSVYLQGKLEVTSNLSLLTTHTVSGISISNKHTTFEGKY